MVCGLNYRPVMTRIDFDDNLVFKLGKTPLICSFFFSDLFDSASTMGRNSEGDPSKREFNYMDEVITKVKLFFCMHELP